MKKQNFVVCYDIKDPKRLKKVHRLISKELLQIQYSIYYGILSLQDMDALIGKLERIIDSHHDDVKVYQTQSLESAFIKGKRSTDIMLLGEEGQQIFW